MPHKRYSVSNVESQVFTPNITRLVRGSNPERRHANQADVLTTTLPRFSKNIWFRQRYGENNDRVNGMVKIVVEKEASLSNSLD